MKKKIVHIIVPDSFNAPYGGMGVGSLNFINRLSDEFEFYVIGFPEENNIKNYTSVYNVLPKTFHGAVTALASQVAYCTASLGLPKPDIVHAYDWSVYLGGLHAARQWNVPLVASMRLSINLLSGLGITYVNDIQSKDGFWLNNGIKEMELIGLEQADVVTCVSESYAQKFQSISGFEERSIVVTNGIDLEEWCAFEKQELPGNGKIKVVFIGRFVNMKGIIPLLKAQIPEDIDLIFVGAEQSSDQFIHQQIIEAANLKSNIHFVGPKYGQEKIDYLNSADAVIVPSVHEPFGIVALEALASKCILLSSRVDGMSDFLNDENSIFCGHTSQDIENALLKLQNMTRQEKDTMISNGEETCKEYAWKKVVLKMKEAYYKALK